MSKTAVEEKLLLYPYWLAYYQYFVYLKEKIDPTVWSLAFYTVTPITISSQPGLSLYRYWPEYKQSQGRSGNPPWLELYSYADRKGRVWFPLEGVNLSHCTIVEH